MLPMGEGEGVGGGCLMDLKTKNVAQAYLGNANILDGSL